jgi:hypothetical protein
MASINQNEDFSLWEGSHMNITKYCYLIYKVNSTEWLTFYISSARRISHEVCYLSLISRNSPETLPSAVCKASAFIALQVSV